jgi:DNA-binding MarR family transcriptional regulator
MHNNVIDSSGVLAISTRLQRLSDRLRKDGQRIYDAHGVAFEPKWFPVIYTLLHRSPMSVGELAQEIGYAHPSTISLLKELEKNKWIQSKKDKTDERKRLVQLTAKGKNILNEMEPVWRKMTVALTALTDTQHNLMLAIAEVEQNLDEQDFYSRAAQVKI